MTDQQCNAYFEALSQFVSSRGLGWVITQVQEHIRFGRLETRKIKAGADQKSDEIVFRAARREPLKSEEFSSTREYSPKEQLKLLIDALERALIVTAEMEAVLVDKMLTGDRSLGAIVLIRTDVANREPLMLSRMESSERAKSAHLLGKLLADLRETI
jgi:hypothetical protein